MDDNESSGLLSSIIDFLAGIIEGITNLPALILDGIKSIFVPDEGAIKEQFSNTVANIERTLGFNVDSFNSLFDSVTESPVTDQKGIYNIPGLGEMEITFVDTSFLRDGIDFFRPLIRGFIILMLLFYHYKQLLTFIGQDPAIAHNAEKNYNEYKEKGGK